MAYTLPSEDSHAPAVPTPLHHPHDAITLGEGGTPSVALRSVSKHLGVDDIRAKLELMNPTGSFKDRGTAVMMSVAVELGVTEVVEDSSGNAGASVAAYAARADIRAHIFAPASAPAAKLDQIAVYGATLHRIEGDRQAVTDAAIDFAERKAMVYASHNLSPYFTEGTKSFAYEVVAQFGKDLPAPHRHSRRQRLAAHRRAHGIQRTAAKRTHISRPQAARDTGARRNASGSRVHGRKRTHAPGRQHHSGRYRRRQPAAITPIPARPARNWWQRGRRRRSRHSTLADAIGAA